MRRFFKNLLTSIVSDSSPKGEPKRAKLGCETLEGREVPATLAFNFGGTGQFVNGGDKVTLSTQQLLNTDVTAGVSLLVYSGVSDDLREDLTSAALYADVKNAAGQNRSDGVYETQIPATWLNASGNELVFAIPQTLSFGNGFVPIKVMATISPTADGPIGLRNPDIYGRNIGDVTNFGGTNPVHVARQPNLKTTLSLPDTAESGLPLVATLKIENKGDAVARNTPARIVLQDGFTPVVAGSTAGFTRIGNVVQWNVPTLAVNASVTFKLNLKVALPAANMSVTLTGEAFPANPDKDRSDNVSTDTLIVNPRSTTGPVTAANASVDLDGTIVPTGPSRSVGEWRLTNASGSRKDVRTFVITVKAENVVLAAESLVLYNKADSSLKLPVTVSQFGTTITSGAITGDFRIVVQIPNTPSINTRLEALQSLTFVLQGSILSNKVDALKPSLLQATLNDISYLDPLANVFFPAMQLNTLSTRYQVPA